MTGLEANLWCTEFTLQATTTTPKISTSCFIKTSVQLTTTKKLLRFAHGGLTYPLHASFVGEVEVAGDTVSLQRHSDSRNTDAETHKSSTRV